MIQKYNYVCIQGIGREVRASLLHSLRGYTFAMSGSESMISLQLKDFLLATFLDRSVYIVVVATLLDPRPDVTLNQFTVEGLPLGDFPRPLSLRSCSYTTRSAT